jgi:hypothetical protein
MRPQLHTPKKRKKGERSPTPQTLTTTARREKRLLPEEGPL